MPDKLTTTSYAVLGLLTFGEMSGYDVLKTAQRSIGHFWSPAKSQVYSELRRLSRLGLLTVREVRQQARPDKRIFAITGEGRAALEKWLTEADVQPDQIRSIFTLRVFFGHLVPRESLVAQIKEVRDAAEQSLAELRATEVEISEVPEYFFPYLTLRAGLAHCEAEVRWATEALEALAEHERREAS